MKRPLLTTIFVFFFVLAFVVVASAQNSVEGEWDAVFNTPGGPRPFKLVLKVDGEKLTGTAKRANGDVQVSGTIKGNDIMFAYTISYNGNDVTLTYSGKVNGDTMSGNVSFNDTAGDEWSAKRAAAEKPKSDKP